MKEGVVPELFYFVGSLLGIIAFIEINLYISAMIEGQKIELMQKGVIKCKDYNPTPLGITPIEEWRCEGYLVREDCGENCVMPSICIGKEYYKNNLIQECWLDIGR
jgi:hypothetical protein